jgi:hypothetical protein
VRLKLRRICLRVDFFKEPSPEFRIFIVQPGVSKAEISNDQRVMLASTELNLQETRKMEFRLIASQ